MIGYVILGALAAFGALCAIWALWGMLLPGARGGVMVCLCCRGGEEALVRRYRWLVDCGLLRCPLVLLESSLEPEKQQAIMQMCESIRFMTLAEFTAGLQEERKKLG